MATRLTQFACGATLFAVAFAARAQTSSPAPNDQTPAVVQAASPESASKPAANAGMPAGSGADKSALLLVQASSSPVAAGASKTTGTTTSSTAPATSITTTSPVPVSESADNTTTTESGGPGVREFQGDDVGQVLRLLARQAKINMVVSEAVQGTVTMRLEDVTAMQAISIIVKAKGLSMDKIDDVYYIKTAAERTAEPTESDSYQFSYARAKDVTPLIASQLSSKDPPQIDERTNTMFFRETRSNIDNIRKMLVTIDKPTKQVMIEARLVEVTANPQQSYGINWSGTLGGQTISYGGPSTSSGTTSGGTTGATFTGGVSPFALGDARNNNFFGSLGKLAFGQFAILSVPQMSATLSMLNQDADAEFLANPRIVTADNMQAKIEITRAQPVPEMTFNAQTAQSVFSGFQDKKFGNTLLVKPLINKDNFITLAVKPEISNKIGDQVFNIPNGGSVASPIIDTRSLESNVLIKSGDTLAIGGLLQDEITKSRTKVPVVGDVPLLGYLFQSRNNVRVKRNLLVFVTPTMIEQCYGTGLEDQVTGLHHSGEEYADPNGWRNNAKGAVRLLPTAQRSVAADYPVPGVAPAPAGGAACKTKFKTSAKDRDF